MMKKNVIIYNIIKNKVHTIRGMQVILDSDLAELYEIETKVLNQAVKRNINRFPEEFMFQLTKKEVDNLRSQIVTSSLEWNKKRFLPYVFTEHGVSMLSSVLKSDKAIEINIKIIKEFISMRKFISNNGELFARLDRVELKQIQYDKSFNKVFDALELKVPKQGIFFEGQIFDAYKFVSDLIRSAKKSIILIDNYIDDSVLTLFSKRDKNVKVKIFTKISKQLELDLKKYNSQYALITIEEFTKSHDRFIIIDDKVYHFGASLKDLGKKWFAFSRFDKEAVKLLNKLKKLDSDKK
jgi:hypothetical protein